MDTQNHKPAATRLIKIISFSLSALAAVGYALSYRTVWSQYLLLIFFACYGAFILTTGWTDHARRKSEKRKGIVFSVFEILFGILMISVSIIVLFLVLFVLN